MIVTITANVAKSEEEAEIQKKAGGFVPPTTEEQPSLDEVLAQADEAAGEGEPAEAEPKAEEAAEAKPKKKAKAEKADEEPAAEKPKREKKAKGKKADDAE